MPESGNAPLTADEFMDEVRKVIEDWAQNLLTDRDAMHKVADAWNDTQED